MTLQDVLTQAIADFEANGYDSEERLVKWERLIREALEAHIQNQRGLERQLREHLQVTFNRMMGHSQTLSRHPGVERFTIQNISHRLHGELDRRILASAQLIRRNRAVMVDKTLQRFSGWASSVPKGGSDLFDKRKIKQELSAPLRKLPFEERRVLIDQGHKLTSSVSATIAVDGGAIAGKWLSHWRQAGYDYREDHKDRDGHVYLIRNSWAHKAGFVKSSNDGYSDEITQPAEEVFCRCKYVYLYHLRQVPIEMLTEKGKEALKR